MFEGTHVREKQIFICFSAHLIVPLQAIMEQIPEKPAIALPWFAIRLFSLKQKEVEVYFQSKGLETFIPKQWVDFEGRDGKLHHELRPVVHNLIFVKKTIDDAQLVQLMLESNFKMVAIRKTRESRELYEIPSRQMEEFRIMCNPEVELKKYLSEEEAKMKPGAKVLVKYGPLKGLSGRLVRISKKYYLLKEVPGMGVALKVSRWCCVAVDEA